MSHPTIAELTERFVAGSYTPEAAVADTFAKIDEQNGDLNAFLDVYTDAADTIQAEAAAREPSVERPLAGGTDCTEEQHS